MDYLLKIFRIWHTRPHTEATFLKKQTTHSILTLSCLNPSKVLSLFLPLHDLAKGIKKRWGIWQDEVRGLEMATSLPRVNEFLCTPNLPWHFDLFVSIFFFVKYAEKSKTISEMEIHRVGSCVSAFWDPYRFKFSKCPLNQTKRAFLLINSKTKGRAFFYHQAKI